MIQNIKGSCVDEKLCLSWLLLSTSQVLSVQIALDSEFTNTLRQFIMPHVSGCTLDTGVGTWFFRVGVLNNGTISWSGIPPPVFIDTRKSNIILKKPIISVIHKQAITNGMRFHLSIFTPFYSIIEYSKDSRFLSSSTKMNYYQDPSRGYIDCMGLDPAFTYFVRISTAETLDGFPTNTIHTLGESMTFQGIRSLPFMKPRTVSDKAEKKGESALLVDAANWIEREKKPPIRFTSATDYAKYLMAKANNHGRKI